MFYNISAAILRMLRGKLIQVKMSLYKLIDLDNFTIEENYQF